MIGYLHFTVQDTVKMLMLKGLSFSDAIKEVERILHGKLPDEILSLVEEVNYGRSKNCKVPNLR